MGKITVMIPDQLEQNLRDYISKEYPQNTYGKLSYLVTKALHNLMMNK